MAAPVLARVAKLLKSIVPVESSWYRNSLNLRPGVVIWLAVGNVLNPLLVS